MSNILYSLYDIIVNKELIAITKKTRSTMQKQIILDTIKKLNNHPTVDDVYIDIKKNYPAISKNTVYRNLRQLAEDGEIRKVSSQGDPERYDNTIYNHYHFQCNICKVMSDIEMDYIDDINEIVRQKHKFEIDEHDIVFRGVCPGCA